jgi:hypothetical protein
MLVSQCLNLQFFGSQLGGVRFSGRGRGSDDVTALGFDEPDEIRQRTALADEIIHNEIALIRNHGSKKVGLIREPVIAVGSRVIPRVRLNCRTV